MEQEEKSLFDLIAFNRRNFIKLAVGGAVGIHVTPLPWKLTDDIAIWTQNFPWVPVPSEGDFNHVDTVCTLCPGGCGIRVRRVDDRPVKIEGRTDYPVNPGGICPLGAGGLQLLYNENIRFTGPSKRVGPRGSGVFQEISWEEALKELSAILLGLRQKGRPEAVAAVDGYRARSTSSLLVQRLLQAIGSPNYLRVPTVEDTYALLNHLMQGTDGPMAYDLENATFVLSFGCGLIEGWGAPGRMINAWGIWQSLPPDKRVRVVQVESRASNTASKASKWLAPIPGTETALALGLAHVIVREGIYDAAFVEGQTFGFNDWKTSDGRVHSGFKGLVLQKYAPESVAKITGLSVDDIVSLARDFAKAKFPLALCGKGKGTLNGSIYEFMAVHSLNALVGNFNKPGGVLIQEPIPFAPWPELEMDEIAREGLKRPGLDQAGNKRYPFSRASLNSLTESVLKGDPSPVEALLIFSSNPAYTTPDGGAFLSALKKIPYIVSFSPFKDESALMADLVLPDHTYLEKMEEVVWPSGLQYPLLGFSRPVLKPLYRTRQSGDVIIQLAKAIGQKVGAAFPWKGYEEALTARLKGLFDSRAGLTSYDPGKDSPPWKDLVGRASVIPESQSFEETWKKAKTSGLWYCPVFSPQKGVPFKTQTGRFEFSSTAIEVAVKALAGGGPLNPVLKEMGISAEGEESFMPHYEETLSARENKDYPLLMLPYELMNLSSGRVASPPYLYKTLLDCQLRDGLVFAEINPKTAARCALQEGDTIVLESPGGKATARVHLFEGAMPDVLYLPMGLGHWGYDDFQKGKGVNPLALVEAGKDPLSGQSMWWQTRVRISKA